MYKNGSVAIGDTNMYYVSFGNGNKKLVVLPGLSDGLATVKGKALLLSSSYKKFLKDYTVYMFSRKNDMPDAYTISDMADDQIEVMKKLGIDKAYVMGVSEGGMIGQYMAINHPESIEKLILAVTAPYVNDIVKDAITTWIDMVNRGDHTALMIDTALRMYSDDYLKKNKKYFPLIAKFTKPKNYDRFLKNANAILNFDARNDLSRIKCPTLIIAGSDDHTVGKDAAYELNNGIKNSELFIYVGLGHGAYEEAKDFYDKVLEFCNKSNKKRIPNKIAHKEDWRTNPMPTQHDTFVFNRSFNNEEMKALRKGNIPREMEDKWFYYMEGSTLFAHRSWTGNCIYIIDFKEDNNHVVTVNRDPEQYRRTSNKEDEKELNMLLDYWSKNDYNYYNEWLSETYNALKK